ncbi:threonine ammonia-lyase [Sphingomonas colocasiae]|nr:threonine/serine dehydratase [Sphingomonas colocasiae]
MRKPNRDGVLAAAAKIAEILPETPLLSFERDGATIWCKAESLQPMGAFKLRGAWHRLTDLDAQQRADGVVAFSSGNHAQGVAWSAKRLGMPSTIVMPSDAPRKKLENTRALGAEIILYDRMTEDRAAIGAALAAERGATLVPSFDDAWVIEGQGSAGIEATAQMEARAGGAPDRIVIPCGGGGLSAGIALACPDAEIVIAEPEGWDDMRQSLETGEIVPVGPNPPPTACDALQTTLVSPLTFEVLSGRGATGVAVSEAEVAEAMRFAFDKLRLVVEPGGAAALAAVLAGKVELGERTLVIISGGNVDDARFAAVLSA